MNKSKKIWLLDRNKDRIRRIIKCAKSIIQNLERFGPAGIIHVVILSNIIERPIKIWNANGNLNQIIGKEKIADPIEIEYHTTHSEPIGHWTLKYGKDPNNVNIDLNSCLFSVIGFLIGHDPLELRRWTVLKLKSDFQGLVNLINEILRSKANKVTLMIGGACYFGISPNDAKRILDNSQNIYCHGCPKPGHPRGHASDPLATGPNDSVENYSRTGWKTGFLSRSDQDEVAHSTLSSSRAQRAMNNLNKGSNREAIHIPAFELENSRFLPKGREYENGRSISDVKDISMVTIVLCHHQYQQNNSAADVFVLTFYPRL